jgi:hypothetical protein
MAEIRRLVAQGYSHNDVLKKLKLAPRTYFRYLSGAFEHDWLLLKQEELTEQQLKETLFIIDEAQKSLNRPY